MAGLVRAAHAEGLWLGRRSLNRYRERSEAIQRREIVVHSDEARLAARLGRFAAIAMTAVRRWP
jgi:hypothetical protein